MAPSGSTYGSSERSLSGIYAVLQKEGAARRWMLPYDRLGDEVDRLVVWQPGSIDSAEWDDLLDWVKAGHTAILGGEVETLVNSIDASGDREAHPAAAHAAGLNVATLSVGSHRFAVPLEDRLVHIRGTDGAPLLVSWPLEAGRIYWSADPEWLANGRIGDQANLEYALQLLLPPEGKQVAFDEYHHGYQAANRWWQILRGPLQGFMVVLAIALALLFWAYGARFGSPRPSPAGPPRAAVEYAQSMSHLYRRAGARSVVQQALHRSLTQHLSRLLGGTRGLSQTEIAQRAGERLGEEPELIAALLGRLTPNEVASPSEKELLELSRQTERLQRRMQNAGYRDRTNPGTDSKRT